MLNPFFPNISSDYYRLIPIEIDIEYLLKICIYQKGFRRPIFFQNCSPLLFLPSLAFNWDPAEIRCRIFSSLKGYHFFPGPQTWNLLKIKGTGVIQYSRHFPISFHLFLWTCPSLTPRDAGVLREGLGTQRKLTGLWTLEADEGHSHQCPETPRAASLLPSPSLGIRATPFKVRTTQCMLEKSLLLLMLARGLLLEPAAPHTCLTDP